MEKIIIIDPCLDKRWDSFVENHPMGWVVHLSGWKTVIESTLPHMKGHYLALMNNDANMIQAGLPIYEVRSWLTGNRLVSIPFATLCNPLVSNREQGELLIAEAIRLLRELRLSYIEIRTLNSHFLQDIKSLRTNCHYKNHYIDLSDGEKPIWDNIKNKTIGRWIKKASRHNIQIRVAQNDSDISEFYKLYARTRTRLGLPAQPYRFFKAIYAIFSPSKTAEIMLAELENKVIAGHLCFRFNKRMSVEAVGDDETYRYIGINHFLYWQEIRQACAEGYKTFDFGRTSILNSTLTEFKQRWGTTETDLRFYYFERRPGKAGAITHENSIAYKLMRYLFQNAPHRVQPLLSQFCYRHLG